MKNIKRNNILQNISIIFFTVLASACSLDSETNVESGTKNQILHIGNATEPQDLDPHIMVGASESNIVSALLEGLVDEHPETLEVIPGVAESWHISEDLKSYTFNLRKDARWSNGDPVTAHDFVYAWQRLLTPELAASYAYQLYVVKNAKAFNKGEIPNFDQVGVKALDDSTLTVQLNNPTSYFLSLLAHESTFPVHKETIEKFGEIGERSTLWTRPGNYVGNGPFILKKWALNRILTVEKNPYYWDSDAVKLNGIHFYPIDNTTTEERMFRSGTLHVTYVVPEEKIQVYRENNPGLLHIYPYLSTYYYGFNVTKAPFDDSRVRRAFSMSINRQQIVETITKGGQVAAFALTPPNTKGYYPQTKISFDIEEARKLMAEAGYPDGRGFPTTEILYNTSEGHRKVAVAIQQMWKQALGIEVTLVNQDWKAYLSRRSKLDYQIMRAGWVGDYPDPNTFLDMFVTDGGNNNTGWSNSEYDKLIKLAGETVDEIKRYEIFQEAEKILMNESPIIPIYTYTTKHLISPDVKGWSKNILDRYAYKRLYLQSSKQ